MKKIRLWVLFILLLLVSANSNSNSKNTTLKIISYNIWFDAATATTRLPHLLQEINKYQADIIMLQEVTPWFIKGIQDDSLLSQYQLISSSNNTQTPRSGLTFLVKNTYKIVATDYKSLPSDYGRGLLSATIQIEGVPLCLATTHLDSAQFGATDIRLQQLDVIFKHLKHCDRLILAGDFNYGDQAIENTHFAKNMIDAWHHLKPSSNGYTYDRELNSYSDKSAYLFEQSRRLDRVYTKQLQPIDIQVIGTNPIDQKLSTYPSDHFGILAHLDLHLKKHLFRR